MSWLARAKAHFQTNGQCPTDRTDESQVSSVLAVPSGGVYEIQHEVSSVSSAGAAYVTEKNVSPEELLEAAMRACDFHGDNSAAREQMRRECLELSTTVRADLLEYFHRMYPS